MTLELVAILVLVAGISIGAVGYGRLFRTMEAENPRLYRDLGRPRLTRSSLRTRRLIQRYLWSQRAKPGAIGRLARFLIGYLVLFSLCLLILGALIVGRGL